jgi:hypothetical protein
MIQQHRISSFPNSLINSLQLQLRFKDFFKAGEPARVATKIRS